MKIQLTKEEAEKVFHNALCGIFGSGYWNGYGLEFSSEDMDLPAARKKLTGSRCYEDIIMQGLRDGGKYKVIDHECDGEYNRSISIEDIHEKIGNAKASRILEVIEGTGDIDSDDSVLQSLFFGEVIFG